jgi:amyloid beta precursor protein binding protein 1
VRAFCRDARFLAVVRPRAVELETSGASCRTEALQRMLTLEDSAANTALYVLLRAADHFHATYGHYPGASASHLKA